MKLFGTISKFKNNNRQYHLKNDFEHLCYNGEKYFVDIYYMQNENIKKIINNTSMFFSDDNIIIDKIDKTDYEEIIKKDIVDFVKENQTNINVFYFDKIREELLLFSNRATSGRMYYFFQNDEFFFSNDFTLLASIKDFELSQAGLYSYLKYGAVPEDITFDKQIKSVPVGHYFKLDYDNHCGDYFSYFQFDYRTSNQDTKELLSKTKSELTNIAKIYKNKSIHMLISGGIDSTLFAFYLKESSAKIIGHYCRFGENDPEQKYAEEAANSLNIPLVIHTLDDNKIISEIKDTASNTDFPHSDFSNVSINFLLREIRNKYGKNSIIIECNGADDGFGYAGLLKIDLWKKLYKLPNFILKILAFIFNYGNTWMIDSYLRRRFFYFERAIGKNIYNSYMMSNAGYKIIKNSKKYNSEILIKINSFFNNNIKGNNKSLYQKMNTAQFLHINSRLWTAKGYSPAQNLNLDIKFPFTWKNILDFQSEIPLDMKINGTIVKWPLKKLLENYMSNEFIYRKKSGFAPPILRWLSKEENFNFFKSNIYDGIIINYIKKEKIDKMFKKIQKGEIVSRYVITLLWSLLFFEIWHKDNLKKN